MELGGGLENPGQCCYLNAALQVLLRYPRFKSWARSLTKSEEDEDGILHQLLLVSKAMGKATGSLPYPEALGKILGVKIDEPGDVAEVLMDIFNLISEVTGLSVRNGTLRHKRVADKTIVSVFADYAIVTTALFSSCIEDVMNALEETYELIFIQMIHEGDAQHEPAIVDLPEQVNLNHGLYRIHAAVVFSAVGSGHYCTYINSGYTGFFTKGKWICANDSTVTLSSEQELKDRLTEDDTQLSLVAYYRVSPGMPHKRRYRQARSSTSQDIAAPEGTVMLSESTGDQRTQTCSMPIDIEYKDPFLLISTQGSKFIIDREMALKSGVLSQWIKLHTRESSYQTNFDDDVLDKVVRYIASHSRGDWITDKEICRFMFDMRVDEFIPWCRSCNEEMINPNDRRCELKDLDDIYGSGSDDGFPHDPCEEEDQEEEETRRECVTGRRSSDEMIGEIRDNKCEPGDSSLIACDEKQDGTDTLEITVCSHQKGRKPPIEVGGHVFNFSKQVGDSLYYYCCFRRASWARKAKSKHCKASVVLSRSSMTPINWNLEHSYHSGDEEINILRNKKKIYLHEIVDQLVGDQQITFRQLEELVSIKESAENIVIINNDEDRKMLRRISDKHQAQIRGSLTSSRIPRDLSFINKKPFLLVESTKPPILLFALSKDIRQLNICHRLMIIAIRENATLPEGFRYMFVGFSISENIIPRFWLLTETFDAKIWKLALTGMEVHGFIPSRITELVIGFSKTYRYFASQFKNSNLKVRVLKDLYLEEINRLLNECGMQEDQKAKKLLTICDNVYDPVAVIKASISSEKNQSKSYYRRLLDKWDKLATGRYDQFCKTACVYDKLLNDVATWKNRIIIPNNIVELLAMVIEYHQGTKSFRSPEK